jgi:hypothetical protein
VGVAVTWKQFPTTISLVATQHFLQLESGMASRHEYFELEGCQIPNSGSLVLASSGYFGEARPGFATSLAKLLSHLSKVPGM